MLLAASIPGHPLHIDEAWIGEQAYFLARDGYVHSTLFEGMAGSDQVQVVYHRLFVLAGSIAVRAFGWDSEALRLVTLLSGACLLAAMALYMRREHGRSAGEIVAAMAIMLLIPLNFSYVKIYRPELMMTLFGFLSYWALERYTKSGLARHAAASGLLAAMAALSHLYGLIFLLCAAAMLARTRRRRGVAPFALAAFAAFIPWLIDIAFHFDLFRAQIASPTASGKTTFTLATPFLNLLDEHKRLFRTAEIVPIVTLFLLALGLNLRRLRRGGGDPGEHRLYGYTILLAAMLGMIAPDKAVTRYAIPLFPFFTIAIARALWQARTVDRIERFLCIPAYVMAAILLGYGLFHQTRESLARRDEPEDVNGRIASSIPSGARCVGPMNLIFNQIERCRIVGLYMARSEHAGDLTLARAAAFADEHDARYIIINRLATEEERIQDLETARYRIGDSLEVIAETKDYLVIERCK